MLLFMTLLIGRLSREQNNRQDDARTADPVEKMERCREKCDRKKHDEESFRRGKGACFLRCNIFYAFKEAIKRTDRAEYNDEQDACQ